MPRNSEYWIMLIESQEYEGHLLKLKLSQHKKAEEKNEPIVLPQDLLTVNDIKDIRKNDLLLLSTSRKLKPKDDFRKVEEI